MIKTVWFAVIVILFSACNNNRSSPGKVQTNNPIITTTNTWDDKSKTAFMEKCIAGTTKQMSADKAKAYCSCMLEKLQVKYPIADSTAKMRMDEMITMAKDCMQ